MTDNPDPAGLLDSLWDAYVLQYASRSPSEARSEAALAVMDMSRQIFEKAQARGDLDTARNALIGGQAVWNLLAIDAAAWLNDTAGVGTAAEENWLGYDQKALISQLKFSGAALPPTHGSAVDPVAILLPRWLFTHLLDALQALQKGEVHPIVAPTAAGRHGDTWTWDEMRTRALEHVAFLNGQEISSQRARERVGKALKVAPATLRAWERDCRRSVPSLDDRLEIAREAGRYKVLDDEDPNYTKGDGNSVDAHVLALFNQLRIEPLQSFGQAYRARFGKRHNTPSSAGD